MRIAVAVAAVVLAASAVALAALRQDDHGPAAQQPGAPLVPESGAGSSDVAVGRPDLGAAEPMPLPIVSPEPPPADPGQAPERGVTVTGSAVVEAVPDRSEWSFGVQEQGETARQALDRASEAAARIVAALRREGVAERDLRTEQVSVWPGYDGRGPSGYVASTSVKTLVRDLDRSGRIVDAAVTAGANQVSGPGLATGDREALYRQALAAALDQARANAQALARRAGAQLGPAVAIREAGSMPPPVVAEAAMAAEDSARAVMPIQGGRQQISATVTVTFSLAG